jgi:hypothetical protein
MFGCALSWPEVFNEREIQHMKMKIRRTGFIEDFMEI